MSFLLAALTVLLIRVSVLRKLPGRTRGVDRVFFVACYKSKFAVFTPCNIGPGAFHHHGLHDHSLAHAVRSDLF